MRAVVLGICAAALLCSCAAPTKVQRPERLPGAAPDIRVLLAEGRESVTIGASKGLSVSTPEGMALLDSPDKCTVRVSGGPANIQVTLEPSGKVAASDDEVRIIPKSGSALSFENSSYAGTMSVKPKPDGRLMLVSTAPLETYLEGVLPQEMGNPGVDGYDALKAQAVAARTYAMDKMRRRSREPFDVYAGVEDQVYLGLKGKTQYASSAVNDTRGMVLASGKDLARTYYCACCGGHTSDIRLVWPKREPAPYLFGVPDHDQSNPHAFCGDHRYFRWRYSFTGKELGEILRTTLPKEFGVERSQVGEVVDVEIEGWTQSGRVSAIVVRTTRNEFRIVGDRIRWVLMADVKAGRILPSIMFKFDKVMEGDRVAFLSIAGGGNGHGVGMCQGGAIAMAKKGYTYQMILRHYYPTCDVVRGY